MKRLRHKIDRAAGVLFAVIVVVTIVLGIYGQHRIDEAKKAAAQQQHRLHQQEIRQQANGGRS